MRHRRRLIWRWKTPYSAADGRLGAGYGALRPGSRVPISEKAFCETMGETWRCSMRFAILFSLLLLGACTIRADEYGSRDEGGPYGGLSFAGPDVNASPRLEQNEVGCRGAYARGSQIQDLREGVRDPFCD